MKPVIYIATIVISCVFNEASRVSVLRPMLPAGEYHTTVKGILQCHSTPTNKIQFNWYLSKKSANESEIKGNVTQQIMFDDTLNLEINMAVKDSIGGWKDNAFIYKSTKACSTLKNFMGKMWQTFLNDSGIKNSDCPIQAGTHITEGLNPRIFNECNFPKTFFYGTYKFRYFLSKNNEIVSCVIFVIDIKRPWETD